MIYTHLDKAWGYIQRFEGYLKGDTLCCPHCKRSARFEPGGFFDEDRYECPLCGNIEDYSAYNPQTLFDFISEERLENSIEYRVTPQGEYKSVKLKIGSNPNVYIDTASRTYIIDYDFGDEPYGVDINRTCDTLDALLERNFTPYHRY